MAMKRFKYKATGIVTGMPQGQLALETSSRTFSYLTDLMAQETENIRFYTEGVNGGILDTEAEPYTKDLIWPEVKWKISREEVKE